MVLTSCLGDDQKELTLAAFNRDNGKRGIADFLQYETPAKTVTLVDRGSPCNATPDGVADEQKVFDKDSGTAHIRKSDRRNGIPNLITTDPDMWLPD
jgi:hypothetical protein